MPTYVYKCDECDELFEVRQRMTDEPLAECVLCGTKSKVKRLIQPAGGFRISGRGVYRPTSRLGN